MRVETNCILREMRWKRIGHLDRFVWVRKEKMHIKYCKGASFHGNLGGGYFMRKHETIKRIEELYSSVLLIVFMASLFSGES
jgi:hypothetical protein